MVPSLRWALALACTTAACTHDQPNLPLVTVSGGSKVHGGSHDDDNDAGPGAHDAGDASPDAGDASVPATSCERVEPVLATEQDMITATSTSYPVDFIVTRQAERWTADCTDPRLIIELSDGICPDGFGHQLSMSFSLNDIADGAIHVGNNAIYPEAASSSIEVRYTRPDSLKLYGTWGTCNEASGELIFDEAPDPTAGSIFQARYQFSLTPCGDVSDPAPQMVIGTFRIQLRYELSEFCPRAL